MTMRIAKFIADASIASRRGAEKLIADGRVSVNGAVITSPAINVSDTDIVAVDGRVISEKTETELYAFHKPINTMTTTRDPMGRKTIYDALDKKYHHLKYVGRLDFKTTGLLLLTNDGELARKLTLPSAKIPRTYIATVNAKNLDGLERARRGITVDGVRYQPMQIDVLPMGQLRITISEGKKNEIRIVLRACGAPVVKLHRISYGPIELKNMPVGKIIKISQKTIDLLLKTL